MSLTIFEGLQSEIFVPITPKPVWAPVTKELKDMKVALATAAGVHLKTDKRFNLAGDTTFREIPDTAHSSDLMVSHGGYDNADANRDINCMFPIDRLHELAKKGFIKSVAEFHYGFMGGGGDQEAFTNSTGPEIAKKLKEAYNKFDSEVAEELPFFPLSWDTSITWVNKRVKNYDLNKIKNGQRVLLFEWGHQNRSFLIGRFEKRSD